MVTRVTEESWFSRIGNAFKGIIVGLLMTVVSVPLLFWNEGRAVRTAKGLKEGAKVVVSIQPDAVDAANNEKFVHTSGQVTTTDILRDNDFNIEFNGIRLTRHVEMYQWNEHEHQDREKKLGGGTRTVTTYSYNKDWYANVIDSSQFEEASTHQNPNQALFAHQSQQAENVSLGQFRLPSTLIDMISGQDVMEVNQGNLPEQYRQRATIRNDGPNGSARIYVTFQPNQSAGQPPSSLGIADTASLETDEAENASPDANPNRPELIDLESGNPTSQDTATAANPAAQDIPQQVANTTPSESQVGDVRVWFTATPVTTVSLLSQQIGDSFQPYRTEYNTDIHVLKNGVYSADEMIAQQEAANRALTWALRIAGSFLMFFGLTLLLRPLVVLADVLPIAGSLVGFGTAIVAGLLTIAGSMTVIGVAWLFYRPLLGGTLLVIAAGALFLIFRRGNQQRARRAEQLTADDLA